ncbi:glycosyltransferase [Dyella halodurans]|uniref:Glycosyltransferase n=1 Tax=Dyella halodurans TaxID=1920171 RepID=A0ABV9C6Q5_9GAMM|nr:glycosyltransferase [Dyella halodurans]
MSLLSPSRLTDWPAIVKTLAAMRAETFAANSDGRVGHVLAFWVLPSGWAAMGVSRRFGVPYSLWALGSDIWSLGRIPGIRTVLKHVIGGASFRFADGLRLGDDAEQISGHPFAFLPSARRLNKLRAQPLASSPPFRFLFLGRWHVNKGIDLLLEALTLLDDGAWARISEVHIAGGGPLEELVRCRVDDLLRKGRPVRLSGFLGREAAEDALGNADFLLLPSRVESIPVVFSDAMKMQLPVVSMPVGDLPGLISEYGVGVLANAISAPAFAQAVEGALSMSPDQLRASMLECARRFSIDVDDLCRRFGLVDSPSRGAV